MAAAEEEEAAGVAPETAEGDLGEAMAAAATATAAAMATAAAVVVAVRVAGAERAGVVRTVAAGAAGVRDVEEAEEVQGAIAAARMEKVVGRAAVVEAERGGEAPP